MRRYIVAGNWKMNFSRAESADLLVQLKSKLHDLENKIDAVVCPPSVYLDLASNEIKLSNMQLGAQDMAYSDKSAFTGEISVSMLGEFNCKYVIIGHSERRAMLSEPDDQVASKFELAKQAGITPILCVGEEDGQGFDVVQTQLQAVIDRVGTSGFEGAVVAYEPVWAIGTGKTATPEKVQSVHARIRDMIAAEFRIIYGGSVKSSNAAEIFSQADVDGGLIGGASLKAQDFSDICHAAFSLTE